MLPFLLVGGSPQGQTATDEAKVLSERARTTWEARIKKDWKTVYEFQVPEVRERVPLETFLAVDKPLIFNSYKLGKVKVDKDQGWVEITMHYSLANYPASNEETVWKAWKKVEGIWYEQDKQDEEVNAK
jgi:hypothetical protein